MRERTLHIPIVVQNLPDGHALEGFEPSAVEAIVLGADSDFDLANEDNLRVRVDANAVGSGKRDFTISELDLHLPAGLTVVQFSPRKLRVAVRESAAGLPSAPSNLNGRH